MQPLLCNSPTLPFPSFFPSQPSTESFREVTLCSHIPSFKKYKCEQNSYGLGFCGLRHPVAKADEPADNYGTRAVPRESAQALWPYCLGGVEEKPVGFPGGSET